VCAFLKKKKINFFKKYLTDLRLLNIMYINETYEDNIKIIYTF